MPNIGVVEFVLLAALIAIPAVGLMFLLRNGRKTQPEAFASLHGLTLTSTNRPLIQRYLDRGYHWRVTGGLLGALIPFGTKIPGLEMIGGYLVGVLAAELTEARASRGEMAAASLVPRSLSDYLPDRFIKWMRTLLVTAIALAGLAFLLPQRDPSLYEGSELVIVYIAAAIVVVELLVEGMLHLIVRKPQPATSDDVVAADDAIRAASMHASAGAGVAVLMLMLAAQTFATAIVSDVQLVRWIAPAIGIALMPLAFMTWLRLGHDALWRVRRSADREVNA